MNPATHFLAGWLTASADRRLNRKERVTITLAGVVPDIDGLGIIAEIITRDWENPLLLWSKYHHILHSLPFSLLVTSVSLLLATRRWKTATLAFLSFHLHLLGDIVGARGPDGDQWPIPYLIPFSDAWQLTWKGQWELNAWPNFVITGAALVATIFLAWKRGYSPLEIFSVRADRAFVETLRSRFGRR